MIQACASLLRVRARGTVKWGEGDCIGFAGGSPVARSVGQSRALPMSRLHYNAGQDVRLGDSVRWGQADVATVVVMIAEHAAMPGYDAGDWDYLGEGCMLYVPSAGLVHYPAEGLAADADVVLIQRARPSTGVDASHLDPPV